MPSAVLIDEPEVLRDLSIAWADLLAESGNDELVMHPDWMLAWWDVFGGSGERALRTLAFYEGSRLVGLAPLVARPHRYRAVIPFRRLEMLASGEDEADETCSDYLGILAARGFESAVASLFADALVSGVAGPWDELLLPSMNGDSPLTSLLRNALSSRGLRVSLAELSRAPYIALPRTWDDYLAELSGQKRSQLRRALRALERWGGGPPALERVRSAERLEEGKRVLEALHRERWASAGVYASERYRAFHDRVMPRLLERGALDLGWMAVRGEPVAAFYNIRHGGRVHHYQSGRKLGVPEDVRVGVTMHALLIRDAIETGMRQYDFLAGVSQYKMSLALATRPLVRLRAARPSAVEAARRVAEGAAGRARRLRSAAEWSFASSEARKEPRSERPSEATGKSPVPVKEPRVARALSARTRPIYFGPETDRGGALFGWYHPPSRGEARAPAVVICPPLGYEAICAYPALRELAERLSAAGHPVLRFDYEGTGDSAGLDADPGRVRAWVESVGHAATELAALSGVEETCLFGVRMGATLALKAAAERGGVDRLALWNPCATGKAYVREMKAFRLFAEQTGELLARPKPEGDASEESGGFLFTEETLRDLKALDAAKVTQRAADEVLVIGRDDVPDDDKLARAIESRGAATRYTRLGGYAEMMVAPHKTVFPEAVCAALLEWLASPAVEKTRPPKNTAPTARERGIVASGVREEPIRIGSGGGIFGVLTEPVDEALSRGKPLIVFSNTAGNYRIGPNRMYVEMGRKLAALGIPSVRVDVSGIGDSTIWEDEEENHPYGDRLFSDVGALIEHLKARGRATRFGVAGLCSGAFVAYHTALRNPAIESVVLINLQTFVWEDGMSLEVNPLSRKDQTEYYKRRLFSKEAWMKMLRGGVDVRHALGVVQGRMVDGARARFARVKAKLSADASRGSEVARAFDTLTKRGVDVFVIFSGNDPGIDNLNVEVGASMGALKKHPRFTVETIEGSDHSFTPIWAQAELSGAIVGHLTRLFT